MKLIGEIIVYLIIGIIAYFGISGDIERLGMFGITLLNL